MFLGGASSTTEAELRPPSLKGLLRFWFRAVALPSLGSWQAVQKVENELFGSTNGQAGFILSIMNSHGLKQVQPDQDWKKWHGLGYLGYGVVDRGMTRQPYLKHGGVFTLKVMLKDNVSPQIGSLLPVALKALGLFGAAGARARKGFGSLSLESLRHNGEEKWVVPGNIEELCAGIRKIFGEMSINRHEEGNLPDYTAFSLSAKVKIVKTARDPLQLLDEVGKELLRYRSYGRASGSIHVLPWREKAEQNFADDHDMILNVINGRTLQPPDHPRRVVFGLPHNYFFLSTRQKANVDAANHKRRASPLFIHIHALSTGEYAAVLSLLPAIFLPEGELIKMSGGGHNVQVACQVNYQEIENFLTRSAFRDGVVVWP
ncbi:type III-B CRISPR module RAMP protein Cmr1 [Desulfofundulus thermobenzoicus]|uniref:Type III-B CRISPR module RAMP protein Cmr1 n=1 Tax=Desulfofundulus thermobenzoicus TaxID=29376 RepID=A0A6N7ITE9_9FIRM|nr:type III-B CRISPR module RAMP protein Cmr1 [Desulfofundulus thermobenzoicus]HHW44410.1 type III-B CRISPR module RAMP protein Cmr1 [Desulfotomaculum sp.]